MKNIDGFNGNYLINKDGEIFSKHRRKYLSVSVSQDGYSVVGLCKDGKCKPYRLHRLIASAFIPNKENKPQINHKNSIRTDNRIENLEWVTASENNVHAYKIGNKKPPMHRLGISGKNHPRFREKGVCQCGSMETLKGKCRRCYNREYKRVPK